MNSNDLALMIVREMFKDDRGIDSLNAYKCFRHYFSDLSMNDLFDIASQYGIKYYRN